MAQAGAQREPSMEEILASIRRIIENNEPASAEPEAVHKEVVADETVDADLIDTAAADELRQVLLEDDGELDEAPDDTHEGGLQMVADAMVTAQRTPAPIQRSSSNSLVSSDTGHKVAAAFAELNAAIEAGKARSFDQIAEDMLRPMLTQWLDDNLPTLVERLVREEIERVSRGTRR